MLRHLKIIDYALSSLGRRKAKNLCLAASFVVVVASLSSILFLTNALRGEASRLLTAAPDLVVQRLAAGRHDLIPTSYGPTIEGIPGVGRVAARHWGYYFDAITEANYTLLADDDGSTTLPLLAGRLPAAAGECAVGAGVAASRALGLGDDLILIDSTNLGTSFLVVGVFESASSLLTYDLIVLREEDLRQFFALPADRATDLSVEVRNEAELPTIARKIKTLLPDTRPITKPELARTYEAAFSWRSGMMLAAFAGAVVAFCILAWDKATGLSAEEQHEIGVLKAIGWSTADVLELKVWEGIVISASSFLLGLGLGFVHVFHLGAPALVPALKGWSVLFPEFRLVAYVDPYTLLALASFTVIPYLASTVIPCWRAAIADPETVIRG